MKPIFIVLAVMFVTACNNPGDRITAGNGDSTLNGDTIVDERFPITPVDTAIAGCYTFVSKRDTFNLQLEIKGANATGPLTYNFYEKDDNNGTFQGEVVGDRVTGWYLFKSEGMMSVRQVAFRVGKNQLWPANGPMRESGDSAIFVRPEALSFDSSMAMRKVPCII